MSGWSDTAYASSNTRRVETRTLYRKRVQIPVYSNVSGTEEIGTSYECSGNLKSADMNLSGKLATVMVYKGKIQIQMKTRFSILVRQLLVIIICIHFIYT